MLNESRMQPSAGYAPMASEPRPQSELGELVDRLNGDVAQLDKALSALAERLTPILRPIPTSAKGAVLASQHVASPLGTNLQRCSEGIYGAMLRVTDLLEALAI